MGESSHVRVGTAAIIRKEGAILLGLRKGAHAAQTWAFPGGHLEFGESFEDCIRREIREETGLDVGDISFVEVTNDIFEKDGKHYVTLFFEAVYTGGEPKVLEPEKCDDWQWFSYNDLPEELMIPIKNLVKGGYVF